MRTRSQSRHNSPQQEASPVIVEPLHIELLFLEDQFSKDHPPEVPMADNRTMAELLQAPTEGYEEAIAIPKITANSFKLKHGLINLVQNKQFFGHDKEDPHAHILVAKVSTSSSTPAISSEVAELKDMVRALLLDKKNQSSASTSSPTPAPVKAVEPNCVTCGGSGTLPSNTITNPKEELKAKTVKSSVDEPPEVELKDLPPHLEYAFLKGDNKLPVIISIELGIKEKSSLIKVLKSHKRAIAWKLSDIQGINPEFCTHKILMEEDYKPVMLERLAGNEDYCFLDGFSGYFQIPIDPCD
nr:reverse transcriptase domain-containing protein [Tanacetum cinerariifolium]